MPKTRYLSSFLAALAVLAGAVAVLGSLSVQSNAPLLRELTRLSGPDATDCGLVKLTEDRSAAAACASTALRQGRPFRVAFRIKDPQAKAAVGLYRKTGEPVMWLRYRAEGWGGSQVAPSTWSQVEICRNPSVSATGEPPVRCD